MYVYVYAWKEESVANPFPYTLCVQAVQLEINPLFLMQAVQLEINPLFLMIPATLSASYAFMLPVATPPNAIAFSFGRIKVYEMVRCRLSTTIKRTESNIIAIDVLQFSANTQCITLLHHLINTGSCFSVAINSHPNV